MENLSNFPSHEASAHRARFTSLVANAFASCAPLLLFIPACSDAPITHNQSYAITSHHIFGIDSVYLACRDYLQCVIGLCEESGVRSAETTFDSQADEGVLFGPEYSELLLATEGTLSPEPPLAPDERWEMVSGLMDDEGSRDWLNLSDESKEAILFILQDTNVNQPPWTDPAAAMETWARYEEYKTALAADSALSDEAKADLKAQIILGETP